MTFFWSLARQHSTWANLSEQAVSGDKGGNPPPGPLLSLSCRDRPAVPQGSHCCLVLGEGRWWAGSI